MKGLFLAASAVYLLSGALFAGEGVLLALNPAPAKAQSLKAADLLPSATSQAVLEPGAGDFDALSAVNDPLYREGSKEFLEQAAGQDEAVRPAKPAAAAKPVMRDAPADNRATVLDSAPKPALKKLKKDKPVHSDPVKAKDTL